jgi:glycerophosphoryl diester phosphodiesterase
MRSRILAHRGYWLEPGEKNSLSAFRRAFEGGFGIETDIRDLDGELVVSHDPPTRRNAPMGMEDSLLFIASSSVADGNAPGA